MINDEDSPTDKAIIPEDTNRQLSLPSNMVNRGLELATRVELQRNIQKYQKPIRYFAGIRVPSCIDFSRNGEFAAITGYGGRGGENPELIIWNVINEHTTILSAKIHGLPLGYVFSVALSSSGNTALVGYDDGGILGWDIRAKSILHDFRGITYNTYGESATCIVISPTDQCFAECASYRVCLRDAKSGKEMQRFQGRISCYNQMAFSNDGSKLLVAHVEQTERGELMTLIDLNGELKPVLFGGDRIRDITAVSIFPDNQKLLSLDSDGVITVWNATNSNEILHWSHTKSPSDVNNIISEKQPRENVNLVTKNSIIWGLSSVAVSPDGNRILSGGVDTYMRLWTLSGREIFEFPHDTRVVKVAFSPDGRRALSGCWDGSVYVWELP